METPLLTKSQLALVEDALAIEEQAAKDAGMLGYMARAMVQATLPHSKPTTNEFIRKNGNYTLTMLSPSAIGLPYGSIPRILLAWITTEAIKKKERTLVLGDTLSEFLDVLGLKRTGGSRGDITRLREQMRRMFATTISCDYHDSKRDAGTGFKIASTYNIWWTPQSLEQAGLWQSTVTLDEFFFAEIINSPVPVDLRAIKRLRRSPLALDLYNWLTYRYSYLHKPTVIPWGSLKLQFGADYADTCDGRYRFKVKFLESLKKIHVIYPDSNYAPNEKGLLLSPSKTHIAR